MKNGFIKVAAFSPCIELGNPIRNAEFVIAAAHEAHAKGAQLLVLPRMALVGATFGDLTKQPVILHAAEQAVGRILRGTKDIPTLIIFGAPANICGRIEECAVVALKGEILGLIGKDEKSVGTVRAFGAEAAYGGNLIFAHREVATYKIGVAFDRCNIRSGATVTAVLCATPVVLGASAQRMDDAKRASRACAVVMAEAGRGESTTDNVYGGQLLIAENGEILAERRALDEGMIISEIDTEAVSFRNGGGAATREIYFSSPVSETFLSRSYTPDPFFLTEEEAKSVLAIQKRGLSERIRRLNSRSVVIGVSGGLDSTLALLVSVRAMEELGRPASDVIAVTMPCFGTSSRTLSQANRLMKEMGVTARKVSIKRAVDVHFDQIRHDPDNRNATYENAQARERTQVLMDIAGDEGGFVVGTGDLSELALGWTTYNGDHMSMYAVNADIPKTTVRALVLYAAKMTDNKALARVYADVAATPVSPELLPSKNGKIAQITEETVGPYELHDFFLYHFLTAGATPKKICRLAAQAFRGRYDHLTVKKWLKVFFMRFFASQFKRNCSPDGAAVLPIGLSPRAFAMPSDACVAAWLNDLNEQ